MPGFAKKKTRRRSFVVAIIFPSVVAFSLLLTAVEVLNLFFH